MITLSDLIPVTRDQLIKDGADIEYANSIATYLGIAVSRFADFSNAFCSWDSGNTNMRQLFARQTISMAWDFAETNPLVGAVSIRDAVKWTVAALKGVHPKKEGMAFQQDATADREAGKSTLVCTDPPYYDNIGYADLSDFFYVWLRRSLSKFYPDLFSTLLTPKRQELIADPHRFEDGKKAAQKFFEVGLGLAFKQMHKVQDPDVPMTVFYAFKQTESDDSDGDAGATALSSTGWETMLEGLLSASFQITGTWPMRTEQQQRSRSQGSNALASSIILVCRPLPTSASITTRKDFLAHLKRELPPALRDMQQGNIAPVDLAQAAIGPGMAVFSRYKKVLETDGSPMRVRTALALINQGLDEVLSELESEFDPDTRWALAWFEQYQFDEGPYGEAEVLATAKALSISHLAEAGILRSRAGKVRLHRREELSEDWDPSTTGRLTVWEVTQHLIRRLDQKGETETANLKAKVGGLAETARDLAYRLYTLCERKGWAEEAGYYNSLVVAWPSMASEAFELK
jgi:putative DNA methylase